MREKHTSTLRRRRRFGLTAADFLGHPRHFVSVQSHWKVPQEERKEIQDRLRLKVAPGYNGQLQENEMAEIGL